jgi:hypothetical protein
LKIDLGRVEKPFVNLRNLPDFLPFNRGRRHVVVSLYFLAAGVGMTFLFSVFLKVGAAQARMSAGSGSVGLTPAMAKLVATHVAIYCGLGFVAGFFRDLRVRIAFGVAAQLVVLSTARFSTVGDAVILMGMLLVVFGVSWLFLVLPDVDYTR